MYITLTFIIILFTTWYIKRRRFLEKFNKIPYPSGWLPIIGHYLGLKKREEGLLKSVVNHKILGKTILLYAGLEPVILTMDKKLLEIILSSTSLTTKSVDYTYFERWFGDGLLTSSGHKWSSHRKILTPAFHYSILEDFVKVFENKGVSLINNLRKQLNKKSFNVTDAITLYTLDVICETAMGTSIDAQNNPNHEYNQAVRTYCNIVGQRIISPYGRVDFIYKLSSCYKKEVEAVEILKKFSTQMISNRRKLLQEQENSKTTQKRHLTFVDILIKSTIDGKFLNDEEIREEVDTFLFEGHDTTAIALSMLLYNLSKYSEVQSKAYKEILEVIGDDRTIPATIKDLGNLKYLEMVIKESLRLYPSVAVHGRTLLEDVKFDNSILPKGIMVGINQYALHRDPEVFPDPEMFIPERFDVEKQPSRRHPYAYIPFSAGPRNCIGQRFATLELKSAVSKILRNFEILPAEPFFEPIFYSAVTTQSANGVKVALKEREFKKN